MRKFAIICAIYYASITHGFEPKIVVAQVFVESSFRHNVVNRGCYGLMQINYNVWRKQLDLDPYKLGDIYYNLDKGLDILQIYFKQTGDIWKALHRYNCGYKLNSNYVKKIKRVLEEMK